MSQNAFMKSHFSCCWFACC